ncbi:MAG: hypothetical protein Q9174_005534 [Haloplaca sp. 1 TL-2023]
MRPKNMDDRITEIESVVQSLLKIPKDSSTSKADQQPDKTEAKTSEIKAKKISHDEAQKNPNSKANTKSDTKVNKKTDTKPKEDSVIAQDNQKKTDELNARWQKKMDKLNASWQEKTDKLNADWKKKMSKSDADWYEEMHEMDIRDQEEIDGLNARLDHVDETIIPRLKELQKLNRKSRKFEDLHGISPWEMLCYRHDQKVLRVLNDVAILRADKEYYPTTAFEESFENLLESLRQPEGWKGVDYYHKESPERKAFDAFERELKDALKELGVDGGEEDDKLIERAKKLVATSECLVM